MLAIAQCARSRQTTSLSDAWRVAWWWLFLAVAWMGVVQSAQAAGVHRALLIGINHYRAVPGLQGSVNDVEQMQGILTTRYGFDPANITVLTDEAATREAIVAALEHLVEVSTPEDSVYLHYSGHGSQVRDLSGDEADQVDETIVPQDGRSGTVRDILDDELAAVLARLRARSAVIVLDSCHSGTATRGIDIRTRSIPQDQRIELYQAAATRTRALVPAMNSRFAVFSATAADQEALDGPVDDGYHGFFTHSLARSLASAPPGATLRDIFDGIGAELKRLQDRFGHMPMPEPQLEAPNELLDRPLFTALGAVAPQAPAGREPRLPFAAVLPQLPDQGLLERAVALGAVAGTQWAIYPPGDTEFAPGKAVGLATVTGAAGADAVARLEAYGAPLEPGSRAVALLPAPAPAKIPIRIVHASSEQASRIVGLLGRDIVNVASDSSGASPQFVVDAQGQTLKLLAADGSTLLAEVPTGQLAADSSLARLLVHSAHAAELLTLDNPSSRLAVTAGIAGRPATQSRGIAVVADTAAAPYRVRRAGEARSARNSLQLRVRVNLPAYVTVVDVDPEGHVNVLFPNDYQNPSFHPQGQVGAGEELLLPDSLQSGNLAGFHWDYSPPIGRDSIRVFASADLATATLIRDHIKALQASNAHNGAGTRSADAGISDLRSSLARVATRGIRVSADEGSPAPATAASAAGTLPSSGDWSATTVTVEVGE